MKWTMFAAWAVALALGAGTTTPASAIVRGKPVPALALYGEPKYAPDFKNFDYVNPDAPKTGTYIQSNEAFLTFDTFNPFTLKGAADLGTNFLMHDSLMAGSLDEPASVYGLIAETIEVAPDSSWVQFVLRPGAHFSDNSPITADDVVFSFETLVSKGRPQFRFLFADVEKVEATGPRTVRFSIKNPLNKQLPLIVSGLPVLSKAYWKDRDFTATTLDIPVTSGAYTIESFDVGRYILYKRLDNYWAKDLAVNRGVNNFDHIRYEYFRDDTVQFEGFKNGSYDFVRVVSAQKWATDFNFPAFTDGRVKKLEVPTIKPLDPTTLVLNLRRPLFQDRRVREAINYAFDFESLNASLDYGLFTRERSYWQGSPLEAKGLPGPEEIKLLEPFRDKLPPELFTTEFIQPTTSGKGDNRENLLKARKLLQEAGWEIRDGKLTNVKTGQPFVFEITLVQDSLQRVLAPLIQDLKRLGIEATLRVVDTSQYANRVNSFDYDSIYIGMSTSLTPGIELGDDWGSESADRPGGANYAGVKDPVVDALIHRIVEADDYDAVTNATRALDRVLTFNHYRILRYNTPKEWYAYWTKLKQPAVLPALGLGQVGQVAMALWWMDPAAAATPAETPTAAGAKSEGPAAPGSSDGSRMWLYILGGVIVLAGLGFAISRRK